MLRKKKTIDGNIITVGFWPPKSSLLLETFPITPASYQDYQPPPESSKNKTGCVLDTLRFLKIIPPDLGRKLSHLKTQKQEGTSTAILLEIMQRYNKDKDPTKDYFHYQIIYPLNNIKMFELLYNDLNQKLQPLEATILPIITIDKKGHAVIVAKDSDGILFVIDPQICETVLFNSNYFTNWMITNNTFITQLDLFYKSQEYVIPTTIEQYIEDISELVSWAISEDQVANWQVLHPELPRNAVYDCYLNVFKFLGILPHDIAEHLSRLANTDTNRVTQSGIDMQFVSILHDYYKDKYSQIYKFKIHPFEIRLPSAQDRIDDDLFNMAIEFLKNNLIVSTGTIVWLYRNQQIGHCVIIYNNGSDLIIIDPQQCKQREFHTWKQWFGRQNITHIGIIEKFNSGKRSSSYKPPSGPIDMITSMLSRMTITRRRDRKGNTWVTVPRKTIKKHASNKSGSPDSNMSIYLSDIISSISGSSNSTKTRKSRKNP